MNDGKGYVCEVYKQEQSIYLSSRRKKQTNISIEYISYLDPSSSSLSLFQGNLPISANHSFPLRPPSQRTNLSTTPSNPTPTKTPSSMPSTHPLFLLFPISPSPTPYRSPLHSPIPLFSSPAINDSGVVISAGGLIPMILALGDSHPMAGK